LGSLSDATTATGIFPTPRAFLADKNNAKTANAVTRSPAFIKAPNASATTFIFLPQLEEEMSNQNLWVFFQGIKVSLPTLWLKLIIFLLKSKQMPLKLRMISGHQYD
jgi:hypothetical protein